MREAARAWGVARAVLAAVVTIAATGAFGSALTGDLGYQSRVVRNLLPGAVIDARGAMFKLANSRNSNPDETRDCDSGPLPVNRYPLRIEDSAGTMLLGGRFDGEVPLAHDWAHTYCNSAAVSVSRSRGVRVEGVRARRLWDGIRFSSESNPFTLEKAWLSDVRDDCVENDFLGGGLIRDVLLDGCFVGVSAKASSGRTIDGSTNTVTLEGVLMRLQPYLYKGEVSQGSPLKADTLSPSFKVYDSVFALSGDRPVSRSQIRTGWSKIADCRDNLLLWLSDAPFPDSLGEPPSCFLLVTGEHARFFWEEVRRNWIDCHPAVDRFDDDPRSDPLECDMKLYGKRY